MQPPLDRLKFLPLLLALALPSGAQDRAHSAAPAGPSPTQKGPFATAPYDALTDNRVEVANFNPQPFTGVAVDSLRRIWAVNPYASRIARFPDSETPADFFIDTGLNPVSLAIWDPGLGPAARRLLVVCTGTHALFVHTLNGAVENVIPLDSEPADIVVDHDHDLAFVSCQGSNTVVQIDLATRTVARRHRIEVGERPGNLYWDRGNVSDPLDNRVYVAAAVTGNNTTLDRPPGTSIATIVSLDGFAGGELPDHDVYRIDPFAPADEPEPVVRGAGSLLFDLDRHPVTGELWILSTDSDNADPAKQTEPALNGNFLTNQLVVVPGVTGASSLIQAPAGIDVDDYDSSAPGAQYDATRSLNQARTLCFDGSGAAFVASAHSDVVVRMDGSGGRVQEFQLPEGAQCFALQSYGAGTGRFVALCLGTMTIEVFSFDPFVSTPVASLPLGLDPTPASVRRGRDVFLKGLYSKDGRFSCGSCHPRGMSDQLGWSLSNLPVDVKDVMLTQTLMSIADTYPHHWRGERDLADFEKAFQGLLGATPPQVPVPQEVDDLVVFIQSLQAPANPLQSPRRILDDSRTAAPVGGLFGSAVRGQEVFKTVPNANNNTCVECHIPESGANGNMFIEGDQFDDPIDIAPRTVNIEAAHLRQLQNRGRSAIWIDKNLDGDPGDGSGIEKRDELTNINGFGTSHSGTFATVGEFIRGFQSLTPQEHADTIRFVDQWDQGISPAAHWATLFSQSSPDGTAQDIAQILLQGALSGWNDVAAFGLYDAGAGMTPVRWSFDPAAKRFVSSHPAIADVTWGQMKAATAAGDALHVFLGLPPGNGRRFGIDPDNDSLSTSGEVTVGSDPWNPDTDGDGFLDGHEEAAANQGDALDDQVGTTDPVPPSLVSAELDFVSARMAKYHLRFSEDVVYEIDYLLAGAPVQTFERDYFSRQDTAVLPHEYPGTVGFQNFGVSITMTDRAGNVTGPLRLPDFTPLDTQPIFGAPTPVHVEELEITSAVPLDASTLRVEVRIVMRSHFGAPNFVPSLPQTVLAAVTVSDPVTGAFEKPDDFVTAHATSLDLHDPESGAVFPFVGLPGGEYIVSPPTSAATGETFITFDQPNLVPGQQVKVAIMGSVLESTVVPGAYSLTSIGQLQPLNLEDSLDVTTEF